MLLGVDVGGTFTDAVLVGEDGALYTAKVPSTPREQWRGVLEAVRAVLTGAGAQPNSVERFAHGMTVATNALLEGHAARTALVATDGFTDIVELGRQARPHLYELCLAPPAALAPPELRFGAPERMTPQGPLRKMEREGAVALVQEIAAAAPEAVAVALLHSYAHPAHERLLGEVLSERLPDVHVSLSHELVGTFREYERAASTEVDAALSPLLSGYLRYLCEQADAIGLVRPDVMQSSGGLTDAPGAAAHAALTVLSGPAGGVRGAQLLAELADERDLLCFDMGGTSCDVCLVEDGEVAETAAGVIAGRPLALTTLDIHTVGAGGGSIAWRDAGGALRVGPASAGADPGPACYGRGGTRPTVTDANLLLGRLPVASQASEAPAIERRATPGEAHEGPAADKANNRPAADEANESSAAGEADGSAATGALAGGLYLDRDAAELAVAGLAAELDLSVLRCAEGIVRVAEAEMLRALRVVSVQRGLDPRGLALLAFGGAGPLHAVALAQGLGMTRVLCPRTSGVLCALGLAAAAPRRDAARTVMLTGESFDVQRLAHERTALVERASRELRETPARIAVRYELRYRGQSFELSVTEQDAVALEDARPATADPPASTPETEPPSPEALREAFARAHEQRYGYRDDRAEVELVTIRASAWGATPEVRPTPSSPAEPTRVPWTIVLDGHPVDAERLDGELPPGTRLRGPVLCALGESTLLVPPDWAGEVDAFGTVHLRCEESAR